MLIIKNHFEDRFVNKVMLITGAARGIGKASALRAGSEGAKLLLADKNAAEGEQVCRQIIAAGGNAHFLALDLSAEAGAKAMVSGAIQAYGRIDIAINNTGVMGQPAPVHELTKEQLDFTLLHNFYSVFFCCKYELQAFIKQQGAGVIVNNASIAGLTGLPGNGAYVASKHALNGLTKNLAIDYAKYGIRINSINPSGTNTPMNEEAHQYVKKRLAAAQAAGIPREKVQMMAGQKTKSLLGRDADAEEQAAAILFLASDDASYMTGAMLQTDGGWTAF